MRRARPRLRHLLLAALALALCAGSAQASDRALVDFGSIARIPLDGVPRGARVKASYDLERAEVLVRIEGALPSDLLSRIRLAVENRGALFVSSVILQEDKGHTTLRFLVSRPALVARVIPSDRRKAWFLELYTHRHLTEIPSALPLPMLGYAEQMPAPVPRGASTSPTAVREAWRLLAEAEASLAAGEAEAAQESLDALVTAPPIVLQWAALRQADLHVMRGEHERARAVLNSLTRGDRSPPVAILALVRAAEMSREIGQDVCPGLLVDQALQTEDAPPLLAVEVLARRTRALYLEGRFGEALEAFSVLRRLASSHPFLTQLRPAMATARFRAVLRAMARGETLEALTLAAMLPPKDLSDPIERNTARLQAEAARSLGLYRSEIDFRLRLLLEPIDKQDAAEQLAALVESYAIAGSHERADLSLRFLLEQHTAVVSPERLRTAEAALFLSQGRFERAIKRMSEGFSEGLTTAGEALDRILVARLRMESGGIEAALGHLAALSRQRLAAPGIGALDAQELAGLYDEARALSGRCHELLIELASGDAFRVVDDPARALRLARCAVDAGGAKEAESMLAALGDGKGSLARLARAELAHLRWRHAGGREIGAFLSDRTARSADDAPVATEAAPRPAATSPKEIEG